MTSDALDFPRTAAPPAEPAVEFVEPLTAEQQHTSLRFFDILNFVLRFCPAHASETALMERLARIDVRGGKAFDASRL